MLFKPDKVKRGLVWDIEPDRDEDGMAIDGTGSLRKETDDEMRLRTEIGNKEHEKICDGEVVLIKRTQEEHRELLIRGGVENQKARTLEAVLESWNFDSLEKLTDELARLKRLEDSLVLLMQSQRESLEEYQKELPIINLADWIFSNPKPIFHRRKTILLYEMEDSK